MGWTKGKKRGPRKPKPEAVQTIAAEPAKATSEPKAAPKAEPKAAKKWAARAGSDWRLDVGFVSRVRGHKDDPWEDTSQEDRLRISPELIEGLRREGIVLQWVTHTCLGREERQNVSHYLRGGWTHVQPGDIEGINTVEIDGLKLMARPLEVHKKALKHQADLARAPILARERMLGAGGPGLQLPSGAGAHSSARNFNHIRRSTETLEIPIPEDE
jgi:hypothetical protein